VSIVTDILDRLSGITAVKERVADLTGQLAEIRRLMIEQQKELAQVQGQLKALLQIQAEAASARRK
jgi:DNA-binding FrmR family transcriptional regulator